MILIQRALPRKQMARISALGGLAKDFCCLSKAIMLAFHTEKKMFQSIEDVKQRFERELYICNETIATVVYLADKLHKPVLIEGPAGVGKTEVAKVIAASLKQPLIRLQCYEGLDEAKALYEWEYSKQLLYTQILKGKIGEILAQSHSLQDAVSRIAKEDHVFFSEQFLLPRPLMKALSSDGPTVLLIDEIDKADTEFEAFLLEVLSDFQISVPELGTIQARHIPFVVLTSNNTREMSDALKRRCLHLYIDLPEPAQELAIIQLKAPGLDGKLAEDMVSFLQELRKLDLKKVPGISETLDWARALVILNVKRLDEGLVLDSLRAILKYEGDLRKAEEELKEFLNGKRHILGDPLVKEKDLLH
jgi:MoxR-like ATPase